MIHFDLPKEQSSIIKVIGVGGGGSNAVNHMYSQNISGVDFVICNTDAQAIALSKVPNKVQLGPHLTQGLGAGANPSIGRQATEESLEEIKHILEVNTKMAFITAGMGGGTGTGGAPIIAQICKEMGILTVGIVTTPFAYEGKKRLMQAEEGINFLKSHVDTLLVISNDKLRHQFGNLKMKEAFGRADDVLATAAKCITDVINSTGQINVDFADVCTVMKNGGVAILGSASASGENRAQIAIENALTSPLLNDSEIKGAKWILININSAEGENEFTMDEVEVIQNYLLSQAGEETDVILGLGYDNTLGSDIGITLIATGFDQKDPFCKQAPETKKNDDKVVLHLDIQKADPVAIPVTRELVIENIVEEKIVTPLVLESQPVQQPLPEPVLTATVTPVVDTMMPTLKSEAPVHMELPQEEIKVFVEISSAADQLPATKLDLGQATPVTPAKPQAKTIVAQTTSTSSSNNQPNTFLSKPVQIYAEEPAIQPVQHIEKPVVTEKDAAEELTLIIRNTEQPADEHPAVQSQPELKSEPAPLNNAIQDETEELRRRAHERIAKLRNLSFNVNAADPNNEFETVPAYMRRNMDMKVQLTDAENFYSNYTVKPAENNQIEIGTINTFLDGKKPD